MKNPSISHQIQQLFIQFKKYCKQVMLPLCFLMSTTGFSQTDFNMDANTTAGISAATYLPLSKTALFISGGDMFFYPLSEDAPSDNGWVTIPGIEHLDAALSWDDQTVLLFLGSAYRIFDLNTGEISAEWIEWPVPETWGNRIDAAINAGSGKVYLFNGTDYLVYDMVSTEYVGQGNVTQWEGWPAHWNDGINAILEVNDGFWYFLRGSEVVALDLATGQFLLAQQPVSLGQVTIPKASHRPESPNEATMTASIETSRPPMQETPVYRDDYEEHTPNLQDQTVLVAQPMPNLNWLGAGFDIIHFDPLLPNENRNRKAFPAIIITNSSERAGNTATYLKPYGTNFLTVDAGRIIDTSSLVRKSQEFSKTFNVSVGGSVPLPKGAIGSGSGSYSEINTTRTGSESIYHFNRSTRQIYDLSLKLFWEDQITGEKFRQKLSHHFRSDVARLPVPTEGVNVDPATLKKGVSLPATLNRYKFAYEKIIEKYGTHFSDKVAYGGQYIVRTEITRADYEKYRGSQTSFEAKITKMLSGDRSVGGNGSGGNGSSSGTGNEAENLRSITFVQGGYGATARQVWEQNLKDSPAPYELSFLPIADLLTEIFFPDDPDIEKKQAILIAITTQYILDNYQEPRTGLFDFYRPLPTPEMPGNITVTNKGGYVSMFKLKYYLNGEWKEEPSDHFPVGQTRDLSIPVGATNITLDVGFISLGYHSIFTESFDKSSTVKCYEIWGTIFSQGHAECK